MTILGKLVSGFRKLGKKVADDLSVIGKKIKLSSQLKANFDYGRMTKEMKLQAQLGHLAYEPPAKRPKELNGYQLDEEFNDKYFVVYVGSKVYLVFRGTSPTDARDLVSDYKIVKGQELSDGRFKESLALADKVHQKYPKKSIITVGHSLGGRLAQVVSKLKSYVKKGIGFNPGCGKSCLEESFRYATGGQAQKTYETHKILSDPISMSSGMSGGKVYSYPSRGAKSHSIDNFV